MWAGGAAYPRQSSEPLAGIDGCAIRRVLQKQGTGKAKGADGWGPADLAMLPNHWLDALGHTMGAWEDNGRWPDALRHVILSMIPKSKADTEAGL